MAKNVPKNTDQTISGPSPAISGQRGENTAGRSRAKGKAAPKGKKQATENPQPVSQDQIQKTDMEVHHHPQLEHHAKPWKEYLLEGFMIFIAVMMGFIAENIRDDINNSEHARQLSAQLVHDLRADTAKLNEIYREETKIVRSNDSVFKLLQQPLAAADLKKIQKFITASHSLWLFHPSTGAIMAIKNELHLKQFSNSSIISHISRYEGHIELLHTVQDITLQYQRSFIDPFLYKHFTPANLDAAFAKLPLPDTQMRNLSQQDITELDAQIVLIRINSNELLSDNLLLKNDAVELLKYVTKQFNPEN